ncbi:MAG: heme-degrading domain-containing protein [Treponemataceae bacterium]
MEANKEYLDRIVAEEADLVFDHFDENDAWKLGNLMVEEALKRGIQLTVDIRRPNQILFHSVIRGATPDNDEWIRRKSNVAFRFRKSSLAMHVNLAIQGKTIEERFFLDPKEYVPMGGAFPLVVRGVGMIACATVSSLPHEEDHAFVVECLRKFKG